MKPYLYLLCYICLLFSCKKDKTNTPSSKTPEQFSITLTTITNTHVTDFTLQGSLQVSSLSQAAEYGFIFSSNQDPSLYYGKVIGIGKSQKSLNFTYDVTNLDTGKTYYCRAYVLLNGSVTYSPVTTVGKITPVIWGVTLNDTTSNPTGLSIATNFQGLNASDKISIYMDKQPLKIIGTTTSTTGTTFLTSYPGPLAPGTYTFVINFNNISPSYKTTMLSPPGIWTNLGELSYAQLLFNNQTFGFIKDGWIYSYRLAIANDHANTVTTFVKQNIQTGKVVSLSTFDKATFIFGQAIVFDGKLVHLIGGEEYDLHGIACVNSHYIYNTDTDTWTKEADFPGSLRRSAASVLYNNKIYYGMGYKIPDYNNLNSAEVDRNDMWAYDLQSKTWEKQPILFPQDGRSHSASFAIGSKIYVVAGYDRVTQENSTWCYDIPANLWIQKANFPGKGFEDPASFQLGQFGYVGLGTEGPYDSYLGPTVSQSFFRYDPVNDNWTKLPDLNYGAQYAFCGVNGKYAIVAGGFNTNGGANSIYKYTP